MISRPRVAVLDTKLCGELYELRGFEHECHERAVSRPDSTEARSCTCNPHGTTCAAIISTLAPLATIVSIPVLDDEGMTTTERLADGIEQAVRLDVDLINVSIGAISRRGLRSLAYACKRAELRGIPIVAALGPKTQPAAPAILAGCIAVEASEGADRLMLSQPTRPYADIAACGTYQFRCPMNNDESQKSGSSYATATVTGWLAAQFSRGDWRRSSGIREVLDGLDRLTLKHEEATAMLVTATESRAESPIARLNLV